MNMYTLVKNYKDNFELRSSFNRLAVKTFGLNFEDWYQNGYWKDKYIPYSIVNGREVIANVSVNLMDMCWENNIRHFIQLGTVMTDERYRNQGLIQKIMNEIEREFYAKADGIYLFANDSVLDFYPKFGFHKATEFQYSRQVEITGNENITKISMHTQKEWDILENAIRESRYQNELAMIANVELYMFYVTKFMQENIYYDKLTDTYVIAELEDDTLFLHAIFSRKDISLEQVINLFGSKVKKVILGFTPNEKENYRCLKVEEQDTTLFVKGDVFCDFEERKVMFPTLSHA